MGSQDGKRRKARGFFLLVVLCGLLLYGAIVVERAVKPSMEMVAEVRARSLITDVVTGAVRTELLGAGAAAELLSVRLNEEGKVILVQSNSAAMMNLSTALVTGIQTGLHGLETESLRLPVGTILGSPVLSQTPPYINLKIEPIGSTRVDFHTTFEEQGINQTRYKVSMTVLCTARVIVPFSKNEIKVEMDLPVSETVIVGDVPETYIFVPEEDILDATF